MLVRRVNRWGQEKDNMQDWGIGEKDQGNTGKYISPGKYGYQYLLVLVDTFSGWMEAFPTKGETAMIVAKNILKEIFPRFGLPVTIGSDNGPAFVSQIVQSLALALGTK